MRFLILGTLFFSITAHAGVKVDASYQGCIEKLHHDFTLASSPFADLTSHDVAETKNGVQTFVPTIIYNRDNSMRVVTDKGSYDLPVNHMSCVTNKKETIQSLFAERLAATEKVLPILDDRYKKIIGADLASDDCAGLPETSAALSGCPDCILQYKNAPKVKN